MWIILMCSTGVDGFHYFMMRNLANIRDENGDSIWAQLHNNINRVGIRLDKPVQLQITWAALIIKLFTVFLGVAALLREVSMVSVFLTKHPSSRLENILTSRLVCVKLPLLLFLVPIYSAHYFCIAALLSDGREFSAMFGSFRLWMHKQMNGQI